MSKTKKELKKANKALKNELAELKGINDAIRNTLDSYARHYDTLNGYIVYLLDTGAKWNEDNTFTFPDGQSLVKVPYDGDLEAALAEAMDVAMQVVKEDAEGAYDPTNLVCDECGGPYEFGCLVCGNPNGVSGPCITVTTNESESASVLEEAILMDVERTEDARDASPSPTA